MNWCIDVMRNDIFHGPIKNDFLIFRFSSCPMTINNVHCDTSTLFQIVFTFLLQTSLATYFVWIVFWCQLCSSLTMFRLKLQDYNDSSEDSAEIAANYPWTRHKISFLDSRAAPTPIFHVKFLVQNVMYPFIRKVYISSNLTQL